jgi:hypothetical protein
VWALALAQAAMASCLVAFSFPIITFSTMEVANRTGSCPTSPIWERSHRRLSDDRSWPSSVMIPRVGS